MTIMKVAAVQMRSGTSPERNAADMERMVVQKNNAAVDQLQSIADRFNEQIRIYKAKNNPNGDSSSKKKS